MDKINVFILAAGLGERLHPITNHIPKPLMPVLGKPLLQYVIENVSATPFTKIGMNLYHKKEAIEKWITQCSVSDKITLFPEETILGIGGALKNAEGFLNERTFLVHNSDILSDINLENLIEHHLSSKNLVTLAVHDFPKFNSLVIDEKGVLQDVQKTRSLPSFNKQKLAFTGIAVYEPEFLNFLHAGESSVVDAWLNAISAGHRIGTFDATGCYWSDIGTPSAYASAVFDALRTEGEALYIHPSIKRCKDVDIKRYVVIEKGCVLYEGISLKNCILLPGGNVGSPPHPPLTKGRNRLVPRGQRGGEKDRLLFENCILGPGFKIDINESEIPVLSGTDGKQLIGTGGSDRKYYRVRKDKKKSVVLMQCSSDDPDFERQIEYAHFFLKHSIPVPKLIKVESHRMQVTFEDAGDISLYSYLKFPREITEIENIYRQVIQIMILIHSITIEHIAECPLLQKRIFDYKYSRWETDYFIKRFVEGIRNIRVENISKIENEFHHLAMKADSFPKTVIHRDFQSQNIMIKKGQELRLIDYQGARIGPPAYDVASILWDPYYRLDDNMRERLLDYYINQMTELNTPAPPFRKGGKGKILKGGWGEYNENYFRDTLLSCRLQRHMQALGAYGFLSSVKGKKYFLKYVSEGLRLLKEDISLLRDEYPELYNLVMKL